MYPILARYGSLFVYSYTVVLALGVIAAILLTARLARDDVTPGWFDGVLALLGGAVLAGRAGFVLGQWTYYHDHRSEIWSFNHGGLSYPAAWLGGLFFLWMWARWTSKRFYPYAALFMPGVALATAFGWAACWLDGCAYGRETTFSLWSADLPDEFGVFAVRYQTQLLGLVLALLALATLLWLRRRVSEPLLFWTGLGLLSTAHLLPSLWRGDPIPLFAGLRVDVLFDVVMVLLSVLGILVVSRPGHSSPI